MNILGSYANISSILGVFGKQKIHGPSLCRKKSESTLPLPSLSPPIGLGAQIDEGLLFVRGQMNEFSTNRGGGGGMGHKEIIGKMEQRLFRFRFW